MPDFVPGEIVALNQVPDSDGTWRLAVVAVTDKGPLVGVLTAPRQGGPGAVGFEPVPRLADGFERAQLEALAATVPSEPPVDVNDPRGIKRGPRRAPGMIG